MSAIAIDPRIARTHNAVLSAARELLAEQGWEQVTVTNVADRSGYARSTLYRHWPHRLDLLRDAISEHSRLSHTNPLGLVREDLIAELGAFVVELTTTGLGYMVAAMAHMARTDPEWAQLHQAVHVEGTSVLRAILARANADVTLSSQVDIDDAIDVLVGPIVHRYLFTSITPDIHLVARVVDGFLVSNGLS